MSQPCAVRRGPDEQLWPMNHEQKRPVCHFRAEATGNVPHGRAFVGLGPRETKSKQRTHVTHDEKVDLASRPEKSLYVEPLSSGG